MPAPGKITLVRKDGTRLEATPEQADRLAILGYERETDEQRTEQIVGEATEEYYTTPQQKLLTAVEGTASGASFGASDYLFGDDETKLRATYNPGTRLGTEVLGAVVPMLLTGGESAAARGGAAVEESGILGKAARKAPTNLLSDAARALAPGAEGSLTNAIGRGVIEGGVYGGAGAADHAFLDGEPITAETVLHGIGWGAVVGGALSAFGHGTEKLGEHEANKAIVAEAASKVPEVPAGALRKSAGAEYQALKDEITSLTKAAREATSAADASVKGAIDDLIARGEKADIAAFGNSEAKFVSTVREAGPLYEKVTKAVEAGKFEAAQAAKAEYVSHMADVAKKMGVEMPNVGKPLDDLISLRSVAKELRGMPSSVDAFAAMSPQRFERVAAALEKAGSLPLPNASAIADTSSTFSKALGVEPLAAGDLRSTWKAAKSVSAKEGVVKEVAADDKQVSTTRRLAGYLLGGKAYAAARVAGVGRVGSYAAYRGVKDAVTGGGASLVGVRTSTLGRLRQASADYMPTVGRTVKSAGPRASDPLAYTLFGEKDSSTTDPKKLAMNRAEEIHRMAPTAADTIYRALEPLSALQPQLALSMHASALRSFQALYEMAPKSTGTVNALNSVWRPSDLQAAILSKQLEVFHDPVGVATRMLETGRFDATQAAAMKKIAPAIWQELRVGVLERITQPEVNKELAKNYNAQIGLSTVLDLPIHSSMAPQYIATSQQIFLDRAAPLAPNPRMGQNGGPPNPSDNANSTSAQRSEAR